MNIYSIKNLYKLISFKSDNVENLTEYNITEDIQLKRKNNYFLVLKNSDVLMKLSTYREVLDFMKDLLDARDFITELSLIEKSGLFEGIDHEGLDREKIFQAIGCFIGYGAHTVYAVDFSESNEDNLNWFFKNIYSWKIDKDLLLTLGVKMDYDQYEKEEYIKTYSEKFVDYIQRIYWVTVKYVDGKRYERPLFNPEGSVKLAMNKLKRVAKNIQSRQTDWKNIEAIIEQNRERIPINLTKYLRGYDIHASLILNENWKDLYQIASFYKIRDAIDLNHLEYKLSELKLSSSYIQSKVENGISYWRIIEK